MYFVPRYPTLIRGYKMRWKHFESANGKGEWDGVETMVKKTLIIEQIQKIWSLYKMLFK